jgi:hypothetical protein
MESNNNFNNWLNQLEEKNQKELPKTIKNAYKLIKSHSWAEVEKLISVIPKNTFEYYEIIFLLTHKVANYDEFNDNVFANSYKKTMVNILESMVELCPNNKKIFFQSLLESYNSELLQFEHDMKVLENIRELLSHAKWAESGVLLENELNNGPVNLAWCIMIAHIKLIIDPTYDCKQEYLYFKKHFNNKEARKYYSGYYKHFSTYYGKWSAVNDFPFQYDCVTNMLESWVKYSKRYSSLFLLPYNLICGMICGIKAILIGLAVVFYIVLGVEIYHIFQLMTLSKQKLFRKVLIKKKRILFAQLAYYEKVKYEIENFWDMDFPGSLFGLD